MGLTIGNNVGTMSAIRNFNDAMENFNESQTRLSTGKKYNKGSDDPAKMSTLSSLRMQSSSLCCCCCKYTNCNEYIRSCRYCLW